MASEATSASVTADQRRTPWPPVPRWLVYATCALLFGFYQGINQLIDSDFAAGQRWKPFVWEFSSVAIIVALIPLVVRLERRYRVDSRPRARVVLAHVAGLLAFSATHTVAIVLMRKAAYAAMGTTYDFGDPWLRGFYELQKDAILYGVILVVVFAAREFRVRRASQLRATELAAEVSEARLRQLTAQIEPHFLFNSLNAISNRMHEDVHAADRMMAQLGDLLRAAYESDTSVLVPMTRELEWLRNYTAMMAERFRGRLEQHLDVEPGLDAVAVPRLLLQPLVENALKHGLRDGAGRLSVTVRRRGDDLEYAVSDDGVGLTRNEPPRGTGLENVARRLELLFPGRHSLVVTPGTPRGVTVTVRFPLRA